MHATYSLDQSWAFSVMKTHFSMFPSNVISNYQENIRYKNKKIFRFPPEGTGAGFSAKIFLYRGWPDSSSTLSSQFFLLFRESWREQLKLGCLLVLKKLLQARN